MYAANVWFGTSVGGLMDPQYINAPMSFDKFMSILSHLWIPVIVIGAGGTGGLIRRLRANLLDELQKQYYVTAKAKGLGPMRASVKYPLRMSLNFSCPTSRCSAIDRFRCGTHRDRAVVANRRPLARACLALAGHVSCRFASDVSVLPEHGRRLDLDIALAFLDPRIRLPEAARSERHAANAQRALAALRLASPFDPHSADRLSPQQERLYFASHGG